ncbi:MAG TPA: UbiA family prenyltransferase [Anaerolineales bacterium]|nr:UbiA family prenyltransferase [Anaerolineales bacterium]
MNRAVFPRNHLLPRLWVYQSERFPLFAHSALIAAFSLSAVCFSLYLRGQAYLPSLKTSLVSFLCALLFFLQLRLADEFKDFADDSRFRPYRAVPRGLVTLRELGWLWAISCLMQGLLAGWLSPALLPLLLGVWGYVGLMRLEFFAPHWLKSHPIVYLCSHMLILPLMVVFITACDWRVAGQAYPASGLEWFLLASFFNGVVVEIGRKIRPPHSEEVGVETYTALWGQKRAVLAWLGAAGSAALCGIFAAQQVRAGVLVIGILLAQLIPMLAIARHFVRKPSPTSAKVLEMLSGIWTIVFYLNLGLLPLIRQVLYP